MTFGKNEYIILGVITTIVLVLFLTKKYWLPKVPPVYSPPDAKANPNNEPNSETGWVNGVWVGPGNPPISGTMGDEVADMIDALYTAINIVPANKIFTKRLLQLANQFNDYATRRLANEYKTKYNASLYKEIDGEWLLGEDGKTMLRRLKSLGLEN